MLRKVKPLAQSHTAGKKKGWYQVQSQLQSPRSFQDRTLVIVAGPGVVSMGPGTQVSCECESLSRRSLSDSRRCFDPSGKSPYTDSRTNGLQTGARGLCFLKRNVFLSTYHFQILKYWFLNIVSSNSCSSSHPLAFPVSPLYVCLLFILNLETNAVTA